MNITSGNYHCIEASPWGFPMTIHCDVEQGAKATWTDPGYEPSIDISSVRVGGVDIYRMLETWQLERLEDAVIRALDL